MSVASLDPGALLRDMVRIPSPSGDEGRVAEHLVDWAREHGLQAHVNETGVQLVVQGARKGPHLVLASHLDTVPPGDGWADDPFAGRVENGVLHGRGSVDAKASVAAMAAAAAAVRERELCGRLTVLATYCEETSDTTMPRALEQLDVPPDAAVIGEPTQLAPCIAQRGLLILELTWRGEQLHAGWIVRNRTSSAPLAVEAAAVDITQLSRLSFERTHEQLGPVSLAVTRLNAGVASNMTPPTCTAVIDIRTTPEYTSDEIVQTLKKVTSAEIRVHSDRFPAVATPDGSPLLAAWQRIGAEGETFASPTTSDWVWFRGVDAIKLGPGDSRLSHTNRERIPLTQVERAAEVYADLATEYLQ